MLGPGLPCRIFDGETDADLADADWLGPNTMDAIKKTIVEGRVGMMPPMAAAVGGEQGAKEVANYVLSLNIGLNKMQTN